MVDKLVNYSFTSSEDSTSRDILKVWRISRQTTGTVYYYNVSGYIINYYSPVGVTVTLNFTRKT